MKLYFTKRFDKKLKRCDEKKREKCVRRLDLFRQEPYHQLLRLHPLKGEYTAYWSINITGDLRGIFRYIDDSTVVFVDLDTHSNLYS